MANQAVQEHGKTFENMLKSCFPGASDHGRSNTSEFDIEAKHDKDRHLPTNIKTTKGNTVCMADAGRIFKLKGGGFRLLVLQYEQVKNHKRPIAIHEFYPTEKEWEALKRKIKPAQVSQFHDALKTFKKGEHSQARAFAKKRREEIEAMAKKGPSGEKLPGFRLNPKIDSKSQRRLQCSVQLSHLIAMIKDQATYEREPGEKDVEYRGVMISGIKSAPRNA